MNLCALCVSVVNPSSTTIAPVRPIALDEIHAAAGRIADLAIRTPLLRGSRRARVGGRRSPQDVTLFKSLGLAIEDLAAAHHVYGKALAEGMGTNVEIGGQRAR